MFAGRLRGGDEDFGGAAGGYCRRRVATPTRVAASGGVPRIKDLDTEAIEVSEVARYKRQAMLKCGGSDQTIRNVQGRSSQGTFTVQEAPALGNGTSDWQYASLKTGQEVIFKPPLQLGTAFACREKDESAAEFANRYDT